MNERETIIDLLRECKKVISISENLLIRVISNKKPAQPKLLEACKALVEFNGQHHDCIEISWRDNKQYNRVLDKAKQAIKEAGE